MENLRRVEESEALSKWDNIIQYCKEVINHHGNYYLRFVSSVCVLFTEFRAFCG